MTNTLFDTVTAGGPVAVCPAGRLTVNRGAAALVHGVAVALFLLEDGSLHAVDNLDPCSGAPVLSRGIVGDVEGEPTVASPMYKQRFSLRDGRCLDVEGRSIEVHEAAIVSGTVYVRLGAAGARRAA